MSNSFKAQFATYEILKNYLTSTFGQSNVLNFTAGKFFSFSF